MDVGSAHKRQAPASLFVCTYALLQRNTNNEKPGTTSWLNIVPRARSKNAIRASRPEKPFSSIPKRLNGVFMTSKPLRGCSQRLYTRACAAGSFTAIEASVYLKPLGHHIRRGDSLWACVGRMPPWLLFATRSRPTLPIRGRLRLNRRHDAISAVHSPVLVHDEILSSDVAHAAHHFEAVFEIYGCFGDTQTSHFKPGNCRVIQTLEYLYSVSD